MVATTGARCRWFTLFTILGVVACGNNATQTGPDSGGPDGGGVSEVDAAGAPEPTEPLPFDSTRTVLRDPARGDREVPVRIYYPIGTTGVHPLVLISHGGIGMPGGEDRLMHLGTGLAQRGFVAAAVGHNWSTGSHALDRPPDVSFVLDSLEDETLPLPEGFSGTVDTARVGHAGHSSGAYTAHALGGATYPFGDFRDPRVIAIAPLSPQGVGGFEAFDRGPADNTWVTMRLPLLTLIGGEEIDIDGLGLFVASGWRLQPWPRYPSDSDRFRILVPGQDHRDMGSHGAPDVQEYLAETVAAFFRVYVAGGGDACLIGTQKLPNDIEPELVRAPAARSSRLTECP